MKDITYTFIIPHHNCPELLDRCLTSIPQRDDIQVIVVDDNSDTDKKPIECGRPEVEYIYIEKKDTKGAGRARNVGLSNAKGKWLLFPDSDDRYLDNFLSTLDEYKHMDFDVLYFNSECKDGITNERIFNSHLDELISNYDYSQKSLDRIKFLNNPPWNKMLLREFVLQNNLYFEEVPNGNDILFSLLVGFHAKKIYVDKRILYSYYRNINSIVYKSRKSVLSILCKIEHRVKLQTFYKFIGHGDYKISVFSYLLHLVLVSPLSLTCRLFCDLIRKYPSIYKRRNEWVEIISSERI